MEPIPDEVARALVAAEAPSLLPSLSMAPVAAASLCSVYKAEVDGRPVAVKVQRPGIVAQVAADAYLLRLAALGVERLKSNGRRIVQAEVSHCFHLEALEWRRVLVV